MLYVFAVRDVKAECYNTPFFSPTRGLAIRMFSEACSDERTSLKKYPHDFTLFEIGSFDCSKGAGTFLEHPVHLCCADEFVDSVTGPAEVDTRQLNLVAEVPSCKV
nr:MAG: nonstructural protein [Microviridae sp.]